MPRKGHTQKRDVLADPLYNNKVVTKLINNIMLDGKRGIAQKIVYGAFEQVALFPPNGIYKYSLNHVPNDICHLCQNSCIDFERYG